MAFRIACDPFWECKAHPKRAFCLAVDRCLEHSGLQAQPQPLSARDTSDFSPIGTSVDGSFPDPSSPMGRFELTQARQGGIEVKGPTAQG